MWRYLAAAGSAALLIGAAVLFWQSREGEDALPAPPAYAARDANLPVLGDPAPEPPEAAPATREEKRFNRYDKDRDEAITTQEYFASRQKAFLKLDTNGDGRLSFDEWAIKSREKFAKADADRSSTLNRAEFATTAVVRRVKPRPDCPPAKPADEEEGG